MNKSTIIHTLNEEWKKFFCAHRLEWITSSMHPVLFEYLEHLVFTDVHIDEQINGLSVALLPTMFSRWTWNLPCEEKRIRLPL